MAKTFHLQIISCDRKFYEGPCESLVFQDLDGEYGILAVSILKLKNAVFYDAFSMERKILGETKETFVLPPYTAQLWIKGKSGGRNNVDR